MPAPAVRLRRSPAGSADSLAVTGVSLSPDSPAAAVIGMATSPDAPGATVFVALIIDVVGRIHAEPLAEVRPAVPESAGMGRLRHLDPLAAVVSVEVQPPVVRGQFRNL